RTDRNAAVDAAQSSAQPHGEKRKKPDSENSLEILSTADRVKNEMRKQMWVHGFVGGASTESIWGDQFSFAALSDK
ncbi:hypothetical protein S83_010601, partial [Arachis hypogaea]